MSSQHGSSLLIILYMLLLSSVWDDELSSSQVFCSLTLKAHYSMAIFELLKKNQLFPSYFEHEGQCERAC